MYQLPTTPQGIGQLLDSGFKLFRAGFKNILGLLGVNLLANLAILGIFVSSLMALYSGGANPAAMLSGSAIMMFVGLMVVNIAATVGYTAKYFTVANGSSMGLGESITIGLRKFFPVVIWVLLYFLIIVLGFVALIIPGFIFMITLMFGMYIMVMEDVGPIAGIKRSHNLIWGNWWRTSLYITVVYIIAFIVLMLILVPVGILVAILAGGNPIVISSLDAVNQIISIIIMPFFIAMIIPYYNDLKLRKQGGDLAARIQASSAK